MLVVQPRTSNYSQKELRTIGVRTSVCHGQNIRFVKSMLFRSQLILKVASPNRFSTSTISLGASGLIHKSLDNSVEDHSIIITFLDQFDEVFTSFRAILQVEKKMNISHGCLQYDLILFFC